MNISVSELNAQLKALVESTFLQVCVRGEISNLTIHSSGHIYFSLKDKDSQIRCVMFKGNALSLRFQPKNGLKVLVNGSISVYIPRGEYQIQVLNITPDGLGELALAYQELKNKLQAKGYFNKSAKLPLFPKKIAILTSNTGAAIHDMLKIATKRWNLCQIHLLDTLVQGKDAAESIARNIAYIDSFHKTPEAYDVIVIGRGGGSIEDLWAFNQEVVAEAIFHAQTPIVSAVGHESDMLISDFVADVRAPTPSGAMELLLPDKNEWFLRLDEMLDSLHCAFSQVIKHKSASLQRTQELLNPQNFESKNTLRTLALHHLKSTLDSALNNILQTKKHHIGLLSPLLFQESQNIFSRKYAHLNTLTNTLEAINPQSICAQGFAQIRKNDEVISLKELQSGDTITLQDLETSKEAKIL